MSSSSERSTRISIHAPAGGATYTGTFVAVVCTLISIHAPAGGATSGRAGERDGLSISIHAPAGGATSIDDPIYKKHPISIHAPAGGATQGLWWPQ